MSCCVVLYCFLHRWPRFFRCCQLLLLNFWLALLLFVQCWFFILDADWDCIWLWSRRQWLKHASFLSQEIKVSHILRYLDLIIHCIISLIKFWFVSNNWLLVAGWKHFSWRFSCKNLLDSYWKYIFVLREELLHLYSRV